LNNGKHDQAIRQFKIEVSEYERKAAEYVKASEDLDAKQLEMAKKLVADGSADEELTFLVREVAERLELSQRAASQGDYPKYPDFPDRPWWERSILVDFAAAGVAWLSYMGLRLIGRKPEAIFLIGDAVDRQQRIDKRREQLVWGVGVALIVGTVAGLLAGYLLEL